MLRPLLIGLPLILVIAGGFVAGMNLVPFSSPYFKWVIIGYVVLFPATLIWMITSLVRSARRVLAGGNAALQVTGRKARATVVATRPRMAQIRMGGPRYRLHDVTLRVEDPGAAAYEAKVIRALPLWSDGPPIGQAVEVHIDPRNRNNLFVAWDAAPASVKLTGGVNLDTLSPDLQKLVRMGLDIAAKLKPDAAGAHGVAAMTPDSAAKAIEVEAVPSPPAGETIAGGAIEGRARVEAFQPWPDGTYDLDLHVTPKTRSSYRVALRAAVPHDRIDELKRGMMLDVLVDPNLGSRVEIDWSKGRP